MSLAAVRPFFRTRMIGLGYEEHFDGFDDTNRDQNSLEKLFRMDSGPVLGGASNNTSLEFDYDMTLVITLRGNVDNVELIDRAFEELEAIYTDILSPSNRYGTVIKSIMPGTAVVAPYSVSDDNDLTLTVKFLAKIVCDFA